MTLKEIVTYVCDPCLRAGAEVEATGTHTIAVDKYQTKVDLCAKHEASVMDALRVLMGARGERTQICPVCGYIAGKTPGLAVHIRTRHPGEQVLAVSA